MCAPSRATTGSEASAGLKTILHQACQAGTPPFLSCLYTTNSQPSPSSTNSPCPPTRREPRIAAPVPAAHRLHRRLNQYFLAVLKRKITVARASFWRLLQDHRRAKATNVNTLHPFSVGAHVRCMAYIGNVPLNSHKATAIVRQRRFPNSQAKIRALDVCIHADDDGAAKCRSIMPLSSSLD